MTRRASSTGVPSRSMPEPAGPLVALVRAQQRARIRNGELAACDLDPDDAVRRVIEVKAEQHERRQRVQAEQRRARHTLDVVTRAAIKRRTL